jgi:hypothetical protein
MTFALMKDTPYRFIQFFTLLACPGPNRRVGQSVSRHSLFKSKKTKNTGRLGKRAVHTECRMLSAGAGARHKIPVSLSPGHTRVGPKSPSGREHWDLDSIGLSDCGSFHMCWYLIVLNISTSSLSFARRSGRLVALNTKKKPPNWFPTDTLIPTLTPTPVGLSVRQPSLPMAERQSFSLLLPLQAGLPRHRLSDNGSRRGWTRLHAAPLRSFSRVCSSISRSLTLFSVLPRISGKSNLLCFKTVGVRSFKCSLLDFVQVFFFVCVLQEGFTHGTPKKHAYLPIDKPAFFFYLHILLGEFRWAFAREKAFVWEVLWWGAHKQRVRRLFFPSSDLVFTSKAPISAALAHSGPSRPSIPLLAPSPRRKSTAQLVGLGRKATVCRAARLCSCVCVW